MKRFAPAKINLSLEILRKRPDGFHDLRSLFLPISLVDELVFSPAEAFSLVSTDPTIPTDERNLVFRAAQIFGGENLPKIAIELRKNIPHSAGLGGGSSDAATTLLALNERSGGPFSLADLEKMAAQIGSDVPFFLHRSAAWCEGRGEIVRPVEVAMDYSILLVKPPFGVPTPWAYQKWAESRPLPGIPLQPQETKVGRLSNDLERPVFEKYLVLALMKKWFLEQAEEIGALMSGSGSTMFAITENGDAPLLREKFLTEFGPQNWTFIAQPWAGGEALPSEPATRT